MADGGRSPEDIGRRIVTLREAMGLNQAAFAKLVDISQPSIANYESGLRRPELDKGAQIVLKTGITLDWLYLGERQGLSARLLELLPALDDIRQRA